MMKKETEIVLLYYRRKGECVESSEDEEAGNIGEYVEDDNGRKSDAVKQAFEKIGDV